MIKHYYVGLKNPDRKQRYEIIAGSRDYQLFEETLLNKKNPNKGGLSFNFGKIPPHFNDTAKKNADYCITRGGSISSIYTPLKAVANGWGDIQNPKTKIKTGDALLVILSHDLSTIELFICPGARSMAAQLHQSLCDGFLDTQIDIFREMYNRGLKAA